MGEGGTMPIVSLNFLFFAVGRKRLFERKMMLFASVRRLFTRTGRLFTKIRRLVVFATSLVVITTRVVVTARSVVVTAIFQSDLAAFSTLHHNGLIMSGLWRW